MTSANRKEVDVNRIATRRDAGFTLIELSLVTALMSVIGVLGLTAMTNYQRTAELEGSADDLVSALRSTAQQSVTEGRTLCMRFDVSNDTYTVFRSACTSTAVVAAPTRRTRGSVALHNPTFTPANATTDSCPTGNACAYFYPRGTGSPGEVVVRRPSGKSITITIEGLTSRVVRS